MIGGGAVHVAERSTAPRQIVKKAYKPAKPVRVAHRTVKRRVVTTTTCTPGAVSVTSIPAPAQYAAIPAPYSRCRAGGGGR